MASTQRTHRAPAGTVLIVEDQPAVARALMLLLDIHGIDAEVAALARTFDLRGIVYESAAMHRVVTLALQVAAADVPVLITGPNGAGKEKIAEIIQANSGRRKTAFVKVNAGALPDQLLESELFGADAGAFTGATRLRIGRFESANGGTLFLDEIGNLSAAGQAKLLRVLQNGEYERLGSSETRRADVRLLCATNADLHEAVRRGAFRQDLLFRLNVIEIHVPPLRERKDDVLPLAEAILGRLRPHPAPPASTSSPRPGGGTGPSARGRGANWP